MGREKPIRRRERGETLPCLTSSPPSYGTMASTKVGVYRMPHVGRNEGHFGLCASCHHPSCRCGLHHDNPNDGPDYLQSGAGSRFDSFLAFWIAVLTSVAQRKEEGEHDCDYGVLHDSVAVRQPADNVQLPQDLTPDILDRLFTAFKTICKQMLQIMPLSFTSFRASVWWKPRRPMTPPHGRHCGAPYFPAPLVATVWPRTAPPGARVTPVMSSLS